ncbi:uncharacterized protein V1510DRAFT_399368 [Dipodascopsis tothii]|uniref:uncharacterized protein n=1 Tax=Dipodascopsis tothii TaxID=44089 RepID=UPI0034CDDB2B
MQQNSGYGAGHEAAYAGMDGGLAGYGSEQLASALNDLNQHFGQGAPLFHSAGGHGLAGAVPGALAYDAAAGGLDLGRADWPAALPPNAMRTLSELNMPDAGSVSTLDMTMTDAGGGTDAAAAMQVPPFDYLAWADDVGDTRGGFGQFDTYAADGAREDTAAAPAQKDTAATEFMKRATWIQKIPQEVTDVMFFVLPQGQILSATPSVEAVLGYTPADLAGQFITEYLFREEFDYFSSELNDAVAQRTRFLLYSRLRHKNGSAVLFEIQGVPHFRNQRNMYKPGTEPDAVTQARDLEVCKGIFLTARPYRTKSAGLQDMYLEQKMENVRLRELARARPGGRSRPGSADAVPADDDAGVDAGQAFPPFGDDALERAAADLELASEPAAATPAAGFDPKKAQKKMRLAEEYVCKECGTLDSPEWRKGPQGPKTLCNACGLRWSKSQKKKQTGPPL